MEELEGVWKDIEAIQDYRDYDVAIPCPIRRDAEIGRPATALSYSAETCRRILKELWQTILAKRANTLNVLSLLWEASSHL